MFVEYFKRDLVIGTDNLGLAFPELLLESSVPPLVGVTQTKAERNVPKFN